MRGDLLHAETGSSANITMEARILEVVGGGADRCVGTSLIVGRPA
ncbi:hypothetical protein AZ17_3639 [Bordetella bronchiseptica D989]|nr:hypothetical protein AZ17_3639 [Bordetella bronchiseptica D989]